MPHDGVHARIRVTQFIVAALMSGVLILTVVMVLLPVQAQGRQGAAPGAAGGGSGGNATLLITVAILTVVFLTMAYVILPILRRKVAAFAWRRTPPEIDPIPRLAPLWMNNTIVSSALAEAAGLLGAVAYMITQRPEVLAAPALALAAMIIAFPTAGRFLAFVHSVTGRPELELASSAR